MKIELHFGVIDSKYPDKDITTSEVALINEIGTDTIPPRPVFKIGMEIAQEKNKKLIDSALENIVQHLLNNRTSMIERTLVQALTQIGKSAKKTTKDLISSGSMEANAPSTIAKKGFDHPLFETGLLLNSVEYEVTKE